LFDMGGYQVTFLVSAILLGASALVGAASARRWATVVPAIP